jgi:hypothetical protein
MHLFVVSSGRYLISLILDRSLKSLYYLWKMEITFNTLIVSHFFSISNELPMLAFLEFRVSFLNMQINKNNKLKIRKIIIQNHLSSKIDHSCTFYPSSLLKTEISESNKSQDNIDSSILKGNPKLSSFRQF